MIKLKYIVTGWIGVVKDGFDVRDIFVFGGLAMLGYGLYLLSPWIAFSVCGTLLMAIGYLMGGK